MPSKFPAIFNALAAEFHPSDVGMLPKGGRRLPFITARTAMNRLDHVLGPENWWDSYSPRGEHSVFCHLTIRLPDGSTLTKTDVGGGAGMDDLGDDDKSAVSDAFKRAAVKFGVARYLYGNGVPVHAELTAAAPEPQLALPSPAPPDEPRTPAELVAWTNQLAEDHDYDFAAFLKEWLAKKAFPASRHWDAGHVTTAVAAVRSRLSKVLKQRLTTDSHP